MKRPIKRRWWALIALAMIGLVTAAAYLGRDNIFRELIKPTIPFQVFEPPPAPDYAKPNAWAARPSTPTTDPNETDVFFLYPTTKDDGENGWNASITDRTANDRLKRIALPNQAGPFSDAGALWVPYYRQATLFALLSHREDSRDALAFAYTDIARAFDAFVAARDPARPFVLVGAGQGALHLQRLISEKVANADIRSHLVAAYIIDQATPLAMFAANGGLAQTPLCETAAQTGCVVAYSTVTAGDERGMRQLRVRSLVWGADGQIEGLAGRPIACVNPLTGALSQPNAKPAANKGAAAATNLETGMQPPLLPAATGARCVDGALIVEVHRPNVVEPPIWELGTRYKTPRFNLFYANLMSDAETRLAAFKKNHATPPKSK
jgi:hypothetical protein